MIERETERRRVQGGVSARETKRESASRKSAGRESTGVECDDGRAGGRARQWDSSALLNFSCHNFVPGREKIVVGKGYVSGERVRPEEWDTWGVSIVCVGRMQSPGVECR